MAKRPDLTPSQRAIVDRYYQHRETIHATRLGDLVSEIAIGTDPRKLDRLWKSAGEYLVKCGIPGATIAAIIPQRDLRLLGEVAGAVMSAKPPPRIPPARS